MGNFIFISLYGIKIMKYFRNPDSKNWIILFKISDVLSDYIKKNDMRKKELWCCDVRFVKEAKTDACEFLGPEGFLLYKEHTAKTAASPSGWICYTNKNLERIW